MLNKGTLGELELTRSVIKHIKKNSKNTVVGPGVGNDYGRTEVPATMSGDIIVADGISIDEYIAWTKAMNNFAVSGGLPLCVRISIFAPDRIKEKFLKDSMAKFNEFANEFTYEGIKGIQIIGGNTEVSDAYRMPSFLVNVTGISKEYIPSTKSINKGFDIVMTKHAGLMGTTLIVQENKEELLTRFSNSYIDSCEFPLSDFSIWEDVQIATRNSNANIYYMHDVSAGGIHGALWQLGVRIGSQKGILIEHKKIQIRQETIEVAEFFNINPYMLDGTGSLLIVTDNGENLVDDLSSNGIEASIIGNVTDNSRSIIMHDDEERYLTPVKGDEIYKAIPHHL